MKKYPDAGLTYRCSGCFRSLTTPATIHGWRHEGCPSWPAGTWLAPVPFVGPAIREKAQALLGRVADKTKHMGKLPKYRVRRIQEQLISDPAWVPGQAEMDLLSAADAWTPKRRRRRKPK